MQSAFIFGYLPLGVFLYAPQPWIDHLSVPLMPKSLSEAVSICFVFRSFADSTDNCGQRLNSPLLPFSFPKAAMLARRPVRDCRAAVEPGERIAPCQSVLQRSRSALGLAAAEGAAWAKQPSSGQDLQTAQKPCVEWASFAPSARRLPAGHGVLAAKPNRELRPMLVF